MPGGRGSAAVADLTGQYGQPLQPGVEPWLGQRRRDADVIVHAKAVARDDQHVLLAPKPGGEFARAHRQVERTNDMALAWGGTTENRSGTLCSAACSLSKPRSISLRARLVSFGRTSGESASSASAMSSMPAEIAAYSCRRHSSVMTSRGAATQPIRSPGRP